MHVICHQRTAKRHCVACLELALRGDSTKSVALVSLKCAAALLLTFRLSLGLGVKTKSESLDDLNFPEWPQVERLAVVRVESQ